MNGLLLRQLTDREHIAEELVRAGLSNAEAPRKAALFAWSAGALIEKGVDPTTVATACYVPGRIEVLGKHTDYAGGRSLLAAPEKGVCLIAAPRNDDRVNICSAQSPIAGSFRIDSALAPEQRRWTIYPMTVARRLAQNFAVDWRGADMALASDLPVAAGMSSSSALVVATYLALTAVNDLELRPELVRHIRCKEDVAAYLGCVENGQSFGQLAGDRGVGTFGGSEDHTAILCAEPAVLKQYAYCPITFERNVQLPVDHTFVVGSSGVAAEKTGAAQKAYNRLAQQAAAIVQVWCDATGRRDQHLAAVLSSSGDAADALCEVLAARDHSEFPAAALLDRFEQYYAEAEEIIPAAPARLEGDSLDLFGRLVERSMRLTTELLGNQVPETVHLTETARRLGAVAASAFGAGFGGSVWALVPQETSDTFRDRWKDDYANRFPEAASRATFFRTCAGPASFYLGKLAQ